MRLLVALEQHFVEYNGGIYTDIAFDYSYWREYLSVFEERGNIILDMMNDEEKQRAIQKSARETAMRCFSWESRRIRYQKMYERAANLAKSGF